MPIDLYYCFHLNPGPAEPRYALPLQTVDPDQLASKKPTDLDLHFAILYVNLCLYINNFDFSGLNG